MRALSEPPPFDLTDPDIQRCPFPHYQQLRDESPVLAIGEAPASTVVVSRHEDVCEVLRQPDTFSSAILPIPAILFLDPPEHDRIRRTVSRAFTPRAIAGLAPRIRELAVSLLDPFVAAGGGDLVESLAGRLPVFVIGEVLGVPTTDRELLREWSDDTIRALSVQAGATGPDADAAIAGAIALSQYLDEVADRHTREPSDTIASRLVELEAAGELTRQQLTGFLQLMFVAGHETTMAMLSHGVELLATIPGLLDRLRADTELVPAFVEEVLRTYSPLQRLVRRATRDTHIAGQSVAAGTTVFVLLGAANRDERRFVSGDDFDLATADASHLAFGQGIHFCLGAPLARLEGRIVFGELVKRVSSITLDPDRPPQRFAGGTTSELQSISLDVRVKAVG